MEHSKKHKRCARCAEEIKAEAMLCRYCGTSNERGAKSEGGKFRKIRLKVKDKIYYGDIYIPGYTNRVGDVLNDRRQFISLENAYEEAKSDDLQFGCIAINKGVIEWLRLVEYDQKACDSSMVVRSLFND